MPLLLFLVGISLLSATCGLFDLEILLIPYKLNKEDNIEKVTNVPLTPLYGRYVRGLENMEYAIRHRDRYSNHSCLHFYSRCYDPGFQGDKPMKIGELGINVCCRRNASKLGVVLTTLLGLLFTLTGCGRSQGMSPAKVAQQVCHDIHSDKLQETSHFMADNKPLDLGTINDEEDKLLSKAVFGKEEFSVGSYTITGNKATVDVSIATVNMTRILPEMAKVEYDRITGDLTNAEIEKEVRDVMACPLYKKTKVKLNMVREDGQWKVSGNNSNFINTIMGSNAPITPK